MELSLPPQVDDVLDGSFGRGSEASDDTVVMVTPPETPPPSVAPEQEDNSGSAAPQDVVGQAHEEQMPLRRSTRARRAPERYVEVATMTEVADEFEETKCVLQ